ncbi:thermonuclease family protein [Aquimarina rubra]|uniref:Thermonuclease family protein n=1 Tax=Aquimarina rubra TaxID=1920033 RepID=A0ABW5LGL2_9FLAO
MKKSCKFTFLMFTLFLWTSTIAQTNEEKQVLENEIVLEFKKYDQSKIDAIAEYLFVSEDKTHLDYSKKNSLKKIEVIKTSNYDFSSTQNDKNILKGVYIYSMKNNEYQVVEKLFEYMHDTNNILSVNQYDMYALFAYLYYKQGKKDLLKNFLSRLLEGNKNIMKEYNATLPNYQAILAYLRLLDNDINACEDLLSMSIASDSKKINHTIRFKDNSKRDLLFPFCNDYVENLKQGYTNSSNNSNVEIDETSAIFNKETGKIYKKEISGTIIGIVSGDRFVIREDRTKQELPLKIMSINAPKNGEFMAKEAYDFTSKAIFNKEVEVSLVVYSRKLDLFGAIVKYSFVKSSKKFENAPNSTVQIGNMVMAEDRYLNIEILKNGYAKLNDQIKTGILWDAQEEARKNKLGIWSKPETDK